jgi:hypothetical protein
VAKTKSHLKRMEPSELKRKVGNRDTRILATDPKKVIFSLKYFIDTQPKNDKESYSSWEKDGRLSQLLERLQAICDCSVISAIQQGFLKRYDSFPLSKDTHFKCPSNFKDREWWVINKISGQKARVAGVMVGNVFYIVFFDKEHKFWISKLKNT